MPVKTQVYTGTIEVVTCGECGITFGLDSAYRAERRRDHRGFYCPNGHSRYYPAKSELELERDRTAMLRARLDQAKADAEHTERRRRGEKAAKTRLQRRVAAGVCPCCQRTFSNLAAHIAGQHPDWPPTESEDA
jgi:hypothetical protein